MNRFAVVLALGAVAAAIAHEEEKLDRVAALEALRPSLVRVEYTLKYDEGESPYGGQQRMQSSFRFSSEGNLETYVTDERPLETGGFLIEARKVVAPEIFVHPRFIKDIIVRQGDSTASATIVGYGVRESGVWLELDTPLAGARPLEFSPPGEGALYTVTYGRRGSTWETSIGEVSPMIRTRDEGEPLSVRSIGGDALVVNSEGKPVAIVIEGELPTDNDKIGEPLSRVEALTALPYRDLLDETARQAEQSIVKITLRFRSPQAGADGGMGRFRMRFGGMDEMDENATERHVLGVIVGERQVLVLAEMPPTVTRRLERIVVDTAVGEPIEARFLHSLKDYGAFVAELPQPASAAVRLSAADLWGLRFRLLPMVEVRLFGETRKQWVSHARLAELNPGWKNRLYPRIAGADDDCFVFDNDGALLTLPIARRAKTGEREAWQDAETMVLPSAYLREVLSALPAHADASNVPLTEEQENRIAWIGVELQALDSDLARANNVSQQTRDGEFGALVSHVYAGSPAEKAGIETGDVIVRIHNPDRPKPLEVNYADGSFHFEGFMWDRLDDLPEDLFDQMPRPWPAISNTFNKAITEIGFGNPFSIELYRNGEKIDKPFTVVESPAHYDSAPKYKSEPLGLTVRDLTFEIRRYFRIEDDAPGVIVAKIEKGSKASVGGLRPYEIITHVNDAPIETVAAFEKAASAGELRLNVKRMTKGRLVKLNVDAATTQPAAGETPRNMDDE